MDYCNIYKNIIENAKSRVLKGYSERHHIKPHCQGGSDEPENLVDLTAREHFICHWLLMKIYPKNRRLKNAFWMMAVMKSRNTKERYRCSSRVFEIARKAKAEAAREQMKGNKIWVGKKHSDEAKAKISASGKGKNKGSNHPLFKGWYVTPKGKFTSSGEAAAPNGCSFMSIQRWCRQNKPGFSFEPVEK